MKTYQQMIITCMAILTCMATIIVCLPFMLDKEPETYTDTYTYNAPKLEKVEAPEVESNIEKEHPFRSLFDAIRQVETSFMDNPPDGDGGRSIGPYQISKAYWTDAMGPFIEDQETNGTYQDCRNKDYAEKIIVAYMMRYCPEALLRRDYETIARTHNGGPRGSEKSSTIPYWNKVNAITQASN